MLNDGTKLPEHDLIAQFAYVGFNSCVVALDRDTGKLIWQWDSPEGIGFVAILLDGRLIASVQGYTYCLDPRGGQQRWANRLTGLGLGSPGLASIRGTTNPVLGGMEANQGSDDSSAAAAPDPM